MRKSSVAPVLAPALLLVGAACSRPSAAPPPPATATAIADAAPLPAAAPASPASAATVSGAKQPIVGLVDMQDIAWHGADDGKPTFVMAYVKKFPGAFGGIVINATWRDIQPSRNGALVTSDVDAALAEVRTYNAANPSAPLGVKLRVYAGSNAPEWAKHIGGGPVHIERNPKGCPSGSCPLTVGKTWAPEYIREWRAFQAALAARYDDEPLVRQVAVTSCGMQTDEPFVPSIAPASRQALDAAGYTDDAQRACLMGAVEDYAPWRRTIVDYTFNVFSRTRGGPDTEFPVSVMRRCRDALGARCVLDNHALAADLRSADAPIYDAMAALKGPVNFQTEAPRGLGCQWTATIARAVSLGAVSVELWPEERYEGFESFTPEQIQKLASEFASPVPATTPAPACPGFH
jgi:hypothetical protein